MAEKPVNAARENLRYTAIIDLNGKQQFWLGEN